MPDDIPGIHHVTAVASDPRANYEFYTETLGLRLVKRSVNQDDVSVYHLFYADHEGTPGTSMTFFPYTDARPGQVGSGQATAVSFLVPAGSINYWRDRLEDVGVDLEEPRERFGDTVLAFTDPDGLPLELVAREDAPPANLPESPVPHAHAIRGFFGVTLSLTSGDATGDLLKAMGYRQTDREGRRNRYEADGDLGYVVDVLEDPQAPRGIPGAGTVHHVAFRVSRDDHPDWRQLLMDRGLRPTEVIDRKWFESVYAREHGGVLFEYATAEPGYTVDEELDELGERLVLTEWLEDRREEIEAGLPELSP
ncbi:ring-cleaving dioxygenase [Natronorubrum daqingense]|uniref:Glyoxalase family protein n=1 Tax=Natronorubrum daqingense TaxID=588898 RepID=A0A1N7DTS1_9EURY|nr:ring-cleaving dioxygenase [Natronorubrum daqingense]APX96166.1 ring-cleaving dioxygenase [Natronorubrum daqingense]SIR79159.1 glyoxalase family protein [Natronorubrum daqingense]